MKTLSALLVGGSCLVSATAMAAEGTAPAAGASAAPAFTGVVFRPRVGYGLVDYTLTFDDGSEVGADYNPLVLGGTVIGETYFIDLQHVAGSGDIDDGGDFERTETSVTLGMRLGGQASAYVGYMNAESEFNNFATFETAGVIFGIGGTFTKIGAGSLGGGLGMALLGGDFKSPTFTGDADYTIGYSFGLNYTYPFTNRLSLKTDAKLQYYFYDFTTASNETVEETMGSLIATVAYAF